VDGVNFFDKFPLAKAGWVYLIPALLLAWVGTALRIRFLGLLLWLVAGWVAWFFRDPARFSNAGPEAVISPADGKIVALQEVDQPELPGGRALVVSIFMNIFDVHVNRAPLAGRVLSTRRIPGGFVPADRPQAREGNERLALGLQTPAGAEILVVQVAGLVARRIECWARPGELVQRGQRYGMIRFGSRVDVYLPPRALTRVALGQRVRAGETVIAELG
jgi:phosphatidylserine decarboxylase